jgi:hypothetical protein
MQSKCVLPLRRDGESVLDASRRSYTSHGVAENFLLVLQLKDFDEPYTAETVGAGEMGRVCARI